MFATDMSSTCLQNFVQKTRNHSCKLFIGVKQNAHMIFPSLQNCDWKVHKPEAILAETMTGKLLVKRAGLPLHEYGLVDARAAKRQRFEGEAESEEERWGGAA